MALNWRGNEVKRELARATRIGIDATMQAAVLHAKAKHKFVNRTGEAERSIRVVDSAREERGRIVGRWGSTGIVYFRRLEFGFQGTDRLGRVFDQPAFPALRPAAQAEYPNLARRIRRAGRFA